MSKHSIRRGIDGSPITDRSVSSASKCAAVTSLNRVRYDSSALRVASSTSDRLSPRCGTRILHATAGSRGQPGLERIAILELQREIDLGGRHPDVVELLHDRLEHGRIAAIGGSRFSGQLDALDHAAAAHGKHLDHAAAWPDFQAKHVAIAQLGGCDLLLAVTQDLHGLHRVAKLGGLFEAFRARPLRPSGRARS